MMAAAYDAGVNFFDNAEMYADGKSEKVMGAALKKLGWRRGSYLVSTKFFWGLNKGPNERNTLNRKYLIEGINGSLKRLELDYVDLIYCHRADPTRPSKKLFGPCTTSSNGARRSTGARLNGCRATRVGDS